MMSTGSTGCHQCGKELTGKQRKFCSKEHKNLYNHKHLYNYKYSKAYRARSPRNYLGQLRSYYGRRQTLSLDFLEKLYYDQEGLCAITGREMTFVQDGGRVNTNISIDRVDSDIGYEETNVQLVCHIVNLMKNKNTQSELLDWCRAIVAYHDS